MPFTLTTADLVTLLSDVRRAAATDQYMEPFGGVMLHSDHLADGQPVLVGTATDRYVLIQAHVPLEPPTDKPLRFWLTNDQVKQLLVMLRPSTRSGQVAIDTPGKAVVFTQDSMIDFAALTVQLELQHGEDFPDINALVKGTEDRLQPSGEQVTLDPKLLGRITALCRRGESLTIQTNRPGPGSVVRISVGDRLWAYLITRAGETQRAPVFQLPAAEVLRGAVA
uniref:hypothetical protein n=1 Tax=Pseudonocardia sp. CA-138482 TaxID=3240023 RepID=UPI003F499F9B